MPNVAALVREANVSLISGPNMAIQHAVEVAIISFGQPCRAVLANLINSIEWIDV